FRRVLFRSKEGPEGPHRQATPSAWPASTRTTALKVPEAPGPVPNPVLVPCPRTGCRSIPDPVQVVVSEPAMRIHPVPYRQGLLQAREDALQVVAVGRLQLAPLRTSTHGGDDSLSVCAEE